MIFPRGKIIGSIYKILLIFYLFYKTQLNLSQIRRSGHKRFKKLYNSSQCRCKLLIDPDSDNILVAIKAKLL